MDYLTVREVAEIKECSERYIKKLCKDGKLESIQTTSCKGRMKYMVPIFALSEQEQAIYYSKMKKENGFVPAPAKKKASECHKNTSKRRFEDYSEEDRVKIVFWTDLLKEWQDRRSAYSSKVEFDINFLGEIKLRYPDIEISTDILYRRYKAYKDNDYDGVIGRRGGSNKGATKIPDVVWQGFLWYWLDQNQPTVSQSYRNAVDWCGEFYPELVSDIPTERTFRRHIESDLNDAIQIYMRKGEKAMTDRCSPYIERLYDNLHANDVWIADNHTLDIQSSSEDGKTHRLYITAFQDAKSGVLVGWNVTESPNSQSTILALRHGIIRFGIPKMVYFDNGREFLNHDIGGNGHRTHKKSENDIPTPTILKRLGIEMRNAIVRNAKAKPIERTFCTVKNQLSKSFNGYCGGTIIERPESLKRRIKNGEIPKDYEVRDVLDIWIDGDYNLQKYCGRESVYNGMSRLDVWNTDIKNVGVRQATESELNLMLMRSSRCQKVKRNGVFVNIAGEKIWFMDIHETYKHLNEEVFVRYDPADLRQVRVYDINDRYLFTWKNNDTLLVDYITEEKEEIQDAEKLQRKVKGFIKKEAEGFTGGLTAEQKITAIDMEVRRATKGKNEKFFIDMPKRIIPVSSGEPLEMAAGAENLEAETVEVCIDKIISNAERRRKE